MAWRRWLNCGRRQLSQQRTEAGPVLDPEFGFPRPSLAFQRVDTSFDQLAPPPTSSLHAVGRCPKASDRPTPTGQGSASTVSGPTFSAALARAVAWSRSMRPSANFSLTFGMSDSFRASLRHPSGLHSHQWRRRAIRSRTSRSGYSRNGLTNQPSTIPQSSSPKLWPGSVAGGMSHIFDPLVDHNTVPPMSRQ